MRSKMLFALGAALLLVSCGGPADMEYCRSFGVEGTTEFGKCLSYYNQQTAAFSADRDACEMEADGTYPPTLYDHGRTAYSSGFMGPHGHYYGGQTITIAPDYQHNAEVDRLRMRVIAPCMSAKGWNSANDWSAGRHAVSTQPKRAVAPAKAPVPVQQLPWLK